MNTADHERAYDPGHDPAERLRGLLAAQAGPVDVPVPPPGPVHWPSVSAGEAVAEWADLAGWVTGLLARFEVLDQHVVPACWWRHNGHVEALAALRDHERESYSPMAPASASVAWLRALRDVASLLKAWTGDLGCAGGHHDGPPSLPGPSGPGWDQHVAADVARRSDRNGGPQ